MVLSTMLDAESQPVVALDEGHAHDDPQHEMPPPTNIDIEERTPPTLPIVVGQLHKRPRFQESEREGHPSCRDKIKWIGDVPFVLHARTGKIFCGECSMYKEVVAGEARIVCCRNCCNSAGGPFGSLYCNCFCHLLAKTYPSTVSRGSQ